MSKPWWYRAVVFLDDYWHIYVCNFVEKYAEEPYEAEESALASMNSELE